MRKLIIILAFILIGAGAQAQASQWEINGGHNMELNYNLLMRETAQGAFYGTAGYGAGMWLSDNKPFWGHVGAVLAVNLPILLEKRMDEPETVIGRNLGALIPTVGLTIHVEMSNKGQYNFNLPHWVRK